MLQQWAEADTFDTKPNVARPIDREEKRAWEILGQLWRAENSVLPNNAETSKTVFDTYIGLKHAQNLSKEEVSTGPD